MSYIWFVYSKLKHETCLVPQTVALAMRVSLHSSRRERERFLCNVFPPSPLCRLQWTGADLQHVGVGGGAAGSPAAVWASRPRSFIAVWRGRRVRHVPAVAPRAAADAAVCGLGRLCTRVGLGRPIGCRQVKTKDKVHVGEEGCSTDWRSISLKLQETQHDRPEQNHSIWSQKYPQ